MVFQKEKDLQITVLELSIKSSNALNFENDQYSLNLSQDRFKLDIQQYRPFLCIKRNEVG